MQSIDFINIEYIFRIIYSIFFDPEHYKIAYEYFLKFWGVYKILAVVFSLALLYGIVYCVNRIKQIRTEEEARLNELTEKTLLDFQGNPTNERWAQIKRHIDSNNENDWKLAILEADIILGEMLTKIGYQQENIGEKLKAVEKSDFNTIDKAWEAHKFRNSIAHEGSNFTITQREAKKVISLFEDVFKEFEYL
ncbi:MAG: Uncharacterized protein Athens071416_189 [Parcubacteria group bacterium Athens0714_16]|nr:MAG: Uncharacterized protein Athens071416_189 [Parcubacteria group bacterium Athens0714_16]